METLPVHLTLTARVQVLRAQAEIPETLLRTLCLAIFLHTPSQLLVPLFTGAIMVSSGLFKTTGRYLQNWFLTWAFDSAGPSLFIARIFMRRDSVANFSILPKPFDVSNQLQKTAAASVLPAVWTREPERFSPNSPSARSCPMWEILTTGRLAEFKIRVIPKDCGKIQA